MDPMVVDVMMEALRVLLLVAVPIAAALALAGTVVAVIEGATAIHEPALGYAIRLAALVAILYFLTPSIIGLLLRLTDLVYR